MRLENKVALITGATSGIGRAIALLFTREGARLILVGRNPEAGARTVAEVAEAGGQAHFIQADVTQSGEVQAMATAALGQWGRVDVLVNNAGGSRDGRGSVTQVSELGWGKVVQTNLKGVYLVSKEVLPSMIEKGGGTIVNTASSYGMIAAKNMAAYCAAKGGVIALTREMAVDYVSHNIRVNCVCPGAIETPLIEEYIVSTTDPDETRRYLGDRCPQGRMGQPEEVAHAVLFLASAESSYITGVALPVDGGLTAW